MREKALKPVPAPGMQESEASFIQKLRLTWAALIKCVYEVDPLTAKLRRSQLPDTCGELAEPCGGTMKIVSFIDQSEVIEKILRHCKLWKVPPLRAPPVEIFAPPALAERTLEYGFFDPAWRDCI
jgi:hypothetical protein